MAEIIRKTISTNDPLNIGFERSYYVECKEVYKEELDQNLDIKQHAGKLPDGTVKEFFENGKLYILQAHILYIIVLYMEMIFLKILLH